MITGGFKFFEPSLCLLKNGSVAAASSNTEAAKYILDMNKYTEWISVGSDDSTQEELIIDLETSEVLDRMILTEMNFKDFQITYWNGSAWTEFTNVVGANGILYTGINIVDNVIDSAYFEFDNVTTLRIRITCTTTQIPNAQKFLCNLIVTKEIGTLKGYPRSDTKTDANETKVKTIGGKVLVSKGFETVQIKLNFKTHPYQEDITILEELFSRVQTFLVYPCGGRYGTQYFKISQKIWGLKDIFNMQCTGDLASDFEKGVYIIGVNKNITFEEHI